MHAQPISFLTSTITFLVLAACPLSLPVLDTAPSAAPAHSEAAWLAGSAHVGNVNL